MLTLVAVRTSISFYQEEEFEAGVIAVRRVWDGSLRFGWPPYEPELDAFSVWVQGEAGAPERSDRSTSPISLQIVFSSSLAPHLAPHPYLPCPYTVPPSSHAGPSALDGSHGDAFSAVLPLPQPLRIGGAIPQLLLLRSQQPSLHAPCPHATHPPGFPTAYLAA